VLSHRLQNFIDAAQHLDKADLEIRAGMPASRKHL
jgi:hypothetical protein